MMCLPKVGQIYDQNEVLRTEFVPCHLVNKRCCGQKGISHCSGPQLCTLRGIQDGENRILVLDIDDAQ